ncbi:MAG: hypothetical protein HY729_10900, partial [Candidatus Rokubacteria bacterium]|nr:hypothetical protein [Candidatus Rokubacteria bacterium]
LGLALAAAPDRRRAAPRVLLALAAFVVVTGPWIGAVSARAGRLTLGENSSLNYLWLVNREFQAPLVSFEVSRSAAWRLVHPPRHVFDAPDVWEFARPVGGTLPLWFDPGYWHAGAAPRLSAADHAAALRRSARAYGRLALRLLPLAVGLAVLGLVLGRAGWTRRETALTVFAVAPLGGYALIRVEPRYVAGAVVVLGLALLAAVRAAEPRALAAVTLTALPLAVLPVAIDVTYNAAHEARAALRGEALPNQAWRTAGALRAAGVAAGDGVAVAGDPYQAGWARLARVRIVAAVAPGELAPCWADAACRGRLVAALAGTGATALVAERPPAAAVAAGGLRRLAGTDLFAHRLR